MTVDDGISNPTTNRPFEDVLRVRLGRRGLMIGGLATAATTFFASSGVARAARGGDQGPNPTPNRPANGAAPALPAIDFAPLPYPATGGPDLVVSADYEFSTLIPWGESLTTTLADLDPGNVLANTAAEQAGRIGIGHDGMWFFPLGPSNDHGLLCVNHEFGTNSHVLRTSSTTLSPEQVAVSQAAHGVSVVEIRTTGSAWELVKDSPYNRRIHVNSDVTFSGPVAGSPLLENTAANPFRGTVNNCANGYTPWGTYLTCEENFNGYFGATGAMPAEPNPAFRPVARYGFSQNGFSYWWHKVDPRFDLSNADYANERNRFGWIVEIDPMDPDSLPVKRTALGRFKHEGIAITVGRGGRAVGYMGDDETFDYIYKFVSSGNWQSMRARGVSPLDEGTLYVATFNDDGTGEWRPLDLDDPVSGPLLAAKGFTTQAEVLTYARLAGDALGATPMDRPEWTSVAPNGDVYCTLTNNSRRGGSGRPPADAANPLAPNPFGHIIRWRDADQHVGTTFEWDIYVLAQDTHTPALAEDAAFGSPDGLWLDPDNRVFIQTDGAQPTIDGFVGNDQMLVGTPYQPGVAPVIKRLLAGPAGCEITGIAVTPDRRTMFVNVQHPGDGATALTNFPVPGKGGPEVPRDATVVVTRKNGGIIGS